MFFLHAKMAHGSVEQISHGTMQEMLGVNHKLFRCKNPKVSRLQNTIEKKLHKLI